jgi:hypothetical protein
VSISGLKWQHAAVQAFRDPQAQEVQFIGASMIQLGHHFMLIKIYLRFAELSRYWADMSAVDRDQA